MKPDMYENNEEGILCVYKNPKWLVCIKNWKPDNDINGIKHLEYMYKIPIALWKTVIFVIFRKKK